VLAAAGHTVHSICDHIDPDYSTGAPNPANDASLDRLARTVAEQNADVGVAFDGDGDRVVFLTHDGVIVRPEQIAALIMTRCFSRPTIVYDLKCASMVPRVATKLGGRAIMRPSGYGFIKDTMIDESADLGVEVSGHHFYGSIGGGDDALLTALVVLGLVAESTESLSDLIRGFPWPEITPDLRIPFDGDASKTLELIAAACTVPVSRMDGVRAEYPNGWALARASITEPVITFRFEGHQRQDLLTIATEFLAPVPELLACVKKRIE
jgi:phosphomannomutase/phosphoglucomutase